MTKNEMIEIMFNNKDFKEIFNDYINHSSLNIEEIYDIYIKHRDTNIENLSRLYISIDTNTDIPTRFEFCPVMSYKMGFEEEIIQSENIDEIIIGDSQN